MKSIDRLEVLSPPSSCTKFINAFKSFNQVVSSSYGSELHGGFEYKIATFAKDYMKMGISVTPKIHTVIFHIIEFCKITGRGVYITIFRKPGRDKKLMVLIARYMEKIY